MRDCIKSPSPKGFPKLPGAMAGQPGKRGRLFPRRGPTSPLCTGVFSQRGGLVLLPNPAGNGKHKSSHRRKRWEQCFIFQIAWKFKPQGLSQTARSNGGTIWKAREIFLPARAGSPVIHRRIFAEGRLCSLPPNPEWDGNTKLPLLLQKVGVVFIRAEPIDKAGGKKTEKGLGGASCTLPQPLQMRKLKCMPPPAFRAAFSFPPVKTSCFIGVQCVY